MVATHEVVKFYSRRISDTKYSAYMPGDKITPTEHELKHLANRFKALDPPVPPAEEPPIESEEEATNEPTDPPVPPAEEPPPAPKQATQRGRPPKNPQTL